MYLKGPTSADASSRDNQSVGVQCGVNQGPGRPVEGGTLSGLVTALVPASSRLDQQGARRVLKDAQPVVTVMSEIAVELSFSALPVHLLRNE